MIDLGVINVPCFLGILTLLAMNEKGTPDNQNFMGWDRSTTFMARLSEIVHGGAPKGCVCWLSTPPNYSSPNQSNSDFLVNSETAIEMDRFSMKVPRYPTPQRGQTGTDARYKIIRSSSESYKVPRNAGSNIRWLRSTPGRVD